MSLPGPEYVPWALSLVAWAIGVATIGEVVRRVLARWSPMARSLRPVERLVVDLYLGGGVLFGIAALPLGLFYPATPAIVLLVAIALLAILFVIDRRAGGVPWDLRRFLSGFRSPMVQIALASALVLFLVELWVAVQTSTGNTFDSSLLTYYVAHLDLAHSVPLNFLPAAPFGNPYPQGTTVWLASYQGTFGLPAARTSILVTPLFLGIAPLGAYAVGDRLLSDPMAGATFAVFFAFVGSWTRVLVAGSNDFVFAFPLVLLLFSRVGEWVDRPYPTWPDALFFGALAGVAASMNPAGPIWLFLTLLPLTALSSSGWRGRIDGWFARWWAALAVGVAFAIPSLAEELFGGNGLFHPGLPAGAVAAPLTGAGISTAQFIGLADPFLFRGTDVWLSPFPVIRDELAILIVVGAVGLILASQLPRALRELDRFRRAVLAGGAIAIGILAAGVAVRAGAGPLRPFVALTSLAETSILLFSIYSMLAALPVYLLLAYAREHLSGLRVPTSDTGVDSVESRAYRMPRDRQLPALFALGAALLLIVPGVALTAVDLPSYESSLYHAFGNVSQGDLDLLAWSTDHLGPGDRILVAPGSAAGFLPGYVPSAVVLFPMIDGVYVNGSYQTLVRELTNATLDPAGLAALRSLSVQYVAVTGNNTQLYRPFSPAPLVSNPEFALLFHEQDAYLFEWTDPAT